jgi:hypothetical protein
VIEMDNSTTRRDFLKAGALLATSAWFANPISGLGSDPGLDELWEVEMRRGANPLTVLPVLVYSAPQRVEARSWRSWGGIQSHQDAQQEAGRIEKELSTLRDSSDFPILILPVALLSSPEQARNLKVDGVDLVLVYPAGGWLDILDSLIGLRKWTMFFIRERSGPYYLWHEIIHSRFIRGHTDKPLERGIGYEDVVVDDMDGLRWRLRALYGLKGAIGQRIVCIGGPGAWAGGAQVPERARQQWRFEYKTVPIPELEGMIERGRKDEEFMGRVKSSASRYLSEEGVSLATSRESVDEAFLLAEIFLRILREAGAYAITVNGCMGSYARIMPCLTLSLLGDAGYMAYCESDFVVIPAHILLHFISGKPTFFCNQSFPSGGRMLFAHCSCPRRMDGKRREPARITTHFESDWGAATKVEMGKGGLVTVLIPDFEARHWLAFKGVIVETPFLPICRTQIVVEFDADTEELVRELRGFHAAVAYGDYLKEVAYAAKRVGIDVEVLRKG